MGQPRPPITDSSRVPSPVPDVTERGRKGGQPHQPNTNNSTCMPTPVSPLVLSQFLQGYDPGLSRYLIQGFSRGFALGCLGVPPIASKSPKNLPSALQHPHVIKSKIDKELSSGRILGPFISPPAIYNYRVSPLGVVPKKVLGEFRMIHHLSYPAGLSVNDFIPTAASCVTYATIQDAISHIMRSNTIVYMAKVDIQSAFRIIPIRPSDRPLLGFQWDGKYYMDAVLPMGCSSSCAIFESFSCALEWIAKSKLGVNEVIHVIDDFLLLANSFEKCKEDLISFIAMCERLGVPLAPEKTMGPTTALPFLGITLDTVAMAASLPADKIIKCKELLTKFGERKKATLRELQSLLGVLNFACSVIVPGRPFLRRIIDLTIGITKPHHHVRLTHETKQDLLVWAHFLRDFNYQSFFINEAFKTGDYLMLYTDAAGGIGYGAVYGKKWFAGLWPEAWHGYGITVLEFFPIVVAVEVWGPEWKNQSICFMTDNEALVHIINKQTSRDPRVMTLLRKLVLCCLRLNVHFTARHVPGRENVLADKLSRSQVDSFKVAAPWADQTPTPLPQRLCPSTSGLL